MSVMYQGILYEEGELEELMNDDRADLWEYELETLLPYDKINKKRDGDI